MCFITQQWNPHTQKNGQQILMEPIHEMLDEIGKVWFWESMSNDRMKTKTWFAVVFMWMCFSYPTWLIFAEDF